MHFVLAILVFYINGEPKEAHILGKTADVATCKQIAPQAIAAGAPSIPKDVQAVIKCVPFDELPVAASGFGKAESL